MRAVLTEPFVRSLIAAPPEIPKLFGKQLAHLLRDRRHRSLDAKKFPESGDPNLWSARVNDDWRFYFTIDADTYTLHKIQPHPSTAPVRCAWSSTASSGIPGASSATYATSCPSSRRRSTICRSTPSSARTISACPRRSGRRRPRATPRRRT